MQVESIKAEMLGGFSVSVNGQPVAQGGAKLTKPWQLFCYLVLHRDKFISNQKLITVLWADDLLADPANVLKNAVYSLRKELCGGVSLTDSPIIYSTGGYRFDPAVALDLDVDHFVDLCQAAADAENPQEKARLCEEAEAAYKGDFLLQLDQDLWVVPLALNYKRQYMNVAHDLSEILYQANDYKQLLDVTTRAIKVDPLDEKTLVYLFRAMDELKMYRVIVTTYSRMVHHYKDALGSDLPAAVQRIYSTASERINKTEQDIIVIKTELTAAEHTGRPQRGAYYCTYTDMRHMFTLMKRTAERNGQVLVLALFTLEPAKAAATSSQDLERAMAEFKVVAMNNLRKADAISLYSRNQYVILMSVSSLDDGRLVRDRIRERFAGAANSRKITMDVKLTEV